MNAVEMRGIVKQYPLVRAIDGADFTVEQERSTPCSARTAPASPPS
ncbi:MAG: hypothetical protein ACLRNQ_15650 [Flavonifractor plautii]